VCAKDTTDERLLAPGLCAWAVTELGCILDHASLWLSDEQVINAIDTGLLMAQLYLFLATASLKACRPRYKVRPKLHSFVCEIVGRFSQNRLNPRFIGCSNEEDFVGKVTGIIKGKLHGATFCKRALERLLLGINLHLLPLKAR